MLKHTEQIRYSRQLAINDWGEKGQEKLNTARIFVAGAGGLGSAVLYYLAAAGVGTITVCDNDSVQLSNLNRQILHNSTSLDIPKSESAKITLNKLNPEITIRPINNLIDQNNVAELVNDSQLIIDCLDNFKTRFILNQISVKNKIPLIHAGVEKFSGQITFLHPPRTACLACIFPETPHPAEPHPIAGATAGVIGSLQAIEAIKFLTGLNSNLQNNMIYWDGLTMKFTSITLSRNPQCPVCSNL